MIRNTMSRRWPATILATVLWASLAASSALAQDDTLTRTTSANGVTVKVTPKSLAPDAGTWVFSVVLDTHSQDLSDDLVATTVMIADAQQIRPSGWAGAAAGGHHREGTLEFAAPQPVPASIELRMQRPGEAEPRSFRWIP